MGIMKNFATPMYEHDCARCTYIGTVWAVRVGMLCDLYAQCGKHGGFILRYGDDGPDYASFPSEYLARYLTDAG